MSGATEFMDSDGPMTAINDAKVAEKKPEPLAEDAVGGPAGGTREALLERAQGCRYQLYEDPEGVPGS